jgi:hypothetical protein
MMKLECPYCGLPYEWVRTKTGSIDTMKGVVTFGPWIYDHAGGRSCEGAIVRDELEMLLPHYLWLVTQAAKRRASRPGATTADLVSEVLQEIIRAAMDREGAPR